MKRDHISRGLCSLVAINLQSPHHDWLLIVSLKVPLPQIKAFNENSMKTAKKVSKLILWSQQRDYGIRVAYNLHVVFSCLKDLTLSTWQSHQPWNIMECTTIFLRKRIAHRSSFQFPSIALEIKDTRMKNDIFHFFCTSCSDLHHDYFHMSILRLDVFNIVKLGF